MATTSIAWNQIAPERTFFFLGGGQIEGSKLKHSQTSKSILEMNFQTDLILELKKPKNPMGEKRRPETSS